MVIAICKVSSQCTEPEQTGDEKLLDILRSWINIHVYNPEFTEKLNATLTKDQLELFEEISGKSFKCFVPADLEKSEEYNVTCLNSTIKNYETKDVDNIIKLIHKAQNHLSEYVLCKYKKVLEFDAQIQKEDEGIKSLDQFTEEEKDFIKTLINKHNYWIYHPTDLKAFVDWAAFQKNNDLIHRVYKKVEEFDKNLTIVN